MNFKNPFIGLFKTNKVKSSKYMDLLTELEITLSIINALVRELKSENAQLIAQLQDRSREIKANLNNYGNRKRRDPKSNIGEC